MVSRIKRYKLEADLRFRCETFHGMSPKESSVAFLLLLSHHHRFTHMVHNSCDWIQRVQPARLLSSSSSSNSRSDRTRLDSRARRSLNRLIYQNPHSGSGHHLPSRISEISRARLRNDWGFVRRFRQPLRSLEGVKRSKILRRCHDQLASDLLSPERMPGRTFPTTT